MLKVSVEKHNDTITKIVLKGHTLYDDYGKDIVCAAASTMLTTTVNASLSFDEDSVNVDIKKDLVTLTVLKDDNITKTLINNFYDLLKELESDYKDNIKIN